jgi:hypothetical protein
MQPWRRVDADPQLWNEITVAKLQGFLTCELRRVALQAELSWGQVEHDDIGALLSALKHYLVTIG